MVMMRSSVSFTALKTLLAASKETVVAVSDRLLQVGKRDPLGDTIQDFDLVSLLQQNGGEITEAQGGQHRRPRRVLGINLGLGNGGIDKKDSHAVV
jgi:hypothetical protein